MRFAGKKILALDNSSSSGSGLKKRQSLMSLKKYRIHIFGGFETILAFFRSNWKSRLVTFQKKSLLRNQFFWNEISIISVQLPRFYLQPGASIVKYFKGATINQKIMLWGIAAPFYPIALEYYMGPTVWSRENGQFLQIGKVWVRRF